MIQVAGLRMKETPILSETAGYNWAGLLLRYASAQAGQGNAIREPRSAKDIMMRLRLSLLMGC